MQAHPASGLRTSQQLNFDLTSYPSIIRSGIQRHHPHLASKDTRVCGSDASANSHCEHISICTDTFLALSPFSFCNCLSTAELLFRSSLRTSGPGSNRRRPRLCNIYTSLPLSPCSSTEFDIRGSMIPPTRPHTSWWLGCRRLASALHCIASRPCLSRSSFADLLQLMAPPVYYISCASQNVIPTRTQLSLVHNGAWPSRQRIR